VRDDILECGDTSPLLPAATRHGASPHADESAVEKAGPSSRTPKLRAARSRRMSIAEWGRQALDEAHRREPVGRTGKKLGVIRAAARGDYPTADIDRMLAEIEMGYGTGAYP